MDRSWEYEDIYGRIDIGYLSRTTREILELAGEIRVKLGKQGYLLENYICKLLEGTAEISSLEAMEQARDLDSEFYALVSSAMSGAEHEHPLYERAKEYIAEHPLDYQEENTRHNIYSIALLDDFIEIEAERYRAELKCKLRAVFDSIDLQHLQRDIGRIAGNFYVERLNLLIHQRFLIVTPMAAFAQGLTDSLLSSLVNRDDETSKLAMQLVLDTAAAAG